MAAAVQGCCHIWLLFYTAAVVMPAAACARRHVGLLLYMTAAAIFCLFSGAPAARAVAEAARGAVRVHVSVGRHAAGAAAGPGVGAAEPCRPAGGSVGGGGGFCRTVCLGHIELAVT